MLCGSTVTVETLICCPSAPVKRRLRPGGCTSEMMMIASARSRAHQMGAFGPVRLRARPAHHKSDIPQLMRVIAKRLFPPPVSFSGKSPAAPPLPPPPPPDTTPVGDHRRSHRDPDQRLERLRRRIARSSCRGNLASRHDQHQRPLGIDRCARNSHVTGKNSSVFVPVQPPAPKEYFPPIITSPPPCVVNGRDSIRSGRLSSTPIHPARMQE